MNMLTTKYNLTDEEWEDIADEIETNPDKAKASREKLNILIEGGNGDKRKSLID